ncbi:phosphate ABC transporter permease subunit PstC [Paramagnetospirillum kuznetsovii]|uniref:Phosphate transport system permease protein n=1 Tax=Paramagnetospirillum kuznetsovii TaxID=2053833 RepID=A0A364NWS2_9PROT|nr:phosphate ABC transporter permease subunit PstC [Paramagnetospirillum kuznetsovii]RAU21549.1 phosphate ABC transporter permease subunit PstC [Paramagnetospirillum kuznetsovii]
MQTLLLAVTLLLLTSLAFRAGRKRAFAMADGAPRNLHSLPGYYGSWVALWSGLPAFAILIAWLMLEPSLVRTLVISDLPAAMQELPTEKIDVLINEVRNAAQGHATANPDLAIAADHYIRLRQIGFAAMTAVSVAMALAGAAFAYRRIEPQLRARPRVEATVNIFLVASSTVAIFTTVGIVLSLLFEAMRFFNMVGFIDFLFGLNWSPQMATRSDQVGSSGAFGMVPLFTGTMLITLISMVVALPLGLFSAIYMSEYAQPRIRAIAKPALEILAGIPTVVFGFFAVITVAPLIHSAGEVFGLAVASESAMAAGIVMGITLIPLISSLSDDVITAVPHSLREGAYGLGATKSETIKQVVLPAALPGIVGGVLLAVSRAIGETMIVVMAAGLSAKLTFNPLEAVTTVTVQIVTLLVGDTEFDSPKTLAAFALGLMLFAITLGLNVVALHIVQKYREKYD